MDEIRELYQSMILDHGRSPRNFKVLDCPTCSQEGHNPVCGDRLTIYLIVENENIVNVSFQGGGCAISMASASLMTQAIKNHKVAYAKTLFEAFHQLVTGQELNPDQEALLDKLMVLKGVSQYPMRVKCATLAWHTLEGALDEGNQDMVTTEDEDG